MARNEECTHPYSTLSDCCEECNPDIHWVCDDCGARL